MGENEELFGPPGGKEQKKKKPRHTAVVFKPQYRKQPYLLPPSLDEMIGEAGLPRFLDAIVERIDDSRLIARYHGGGAGAYHPKSLLKIWLLGWCRKIYTSRPLAMALKRDVEFMWISGVQTPTHTTLNDFRKGLGEDIKVIFKEIVKQALVAGVIDGSELYIDHTKMEADGNRYRMTWKKNIDRYLERVNADLDKLLATIDALNEKEERSYDSGAEREEALKALTPEAIQALVERINRQIAGGQKEKAAGTAEKKALRDGRKRLAKKEEYEQKLEGLDGRNSMSNTDPDATAMMMKDHVSVKPGYNVGIATQNGIVTGFDVSNNANDGTSFRAVLDDAQHNLGRTVERVCADAGYGSMETYESLEKAGIEAYVKYPGWLRDAKGKRGMFETESFRYDTERDEYQCPNGTVLTFCGIEQKKNKRTGYVDLLRKYRAGVEACTGCPYKDRCTQSACRTIKVNPRLVEYRRKAKERLDTAEGLRMRRRRGVEVETVFGEEKKNVGFTRFHVRGLQGVTIEIGLALAARNIRKLYKCFIQFMQSVPRGVLLAK